MTEAELQALRRAVGINQTDMGAMIHTTCHSVSYWGTKGQLRPYAVRWGVPAKMLEGKARIAEAQRQRWAAYRQ
jgi:hypothetical protein